MFEGNFSAIVGDRYAEFLAACSALLNPVVCTNVQGGSIIISVRGTANELIAKKKEIVKAGFVLSEFTALKLRK